MKYLLNGVAIAAALVIAAPVWAQNAAPAGSAPAKPAPAPAAAAPAAAPAAGGAMPMASKQMHRKRPMRMAHRKGRAKVAAGDATTEQLNRDELSRLQGGPPPAAAMPPGGAGQPGPRASGH